MSYSIEDLKGLVSEAGGFARPNLFSVQLPPVDDRLRTTSSLNLLCKNVQLPARQINATQMPIGLVNRDIANGYAIQDITMTFRMLNDAAVKDYFDYWQSLIVNPESYEVGFYRDYAKSIKISVVKKSFSVPELSRKIFDFKSTIPSEIRNRLPVIGPLNLPQGELDLNLLLENQIVYEVELLEAYPTSVMAVDLSDDAVDGLMDITVNFTYKNWRSASAPPASQSIAESIFQSVLDKVGIPTFNLNTSNKSE